VSIRVPFIDFSEPGNTCSQVFGRAFSMPMSLWLTFRILGFEPFSGSFSVIMLRSESKFVHSSILASPGRMAVSLRSCVNAAFFFLLLAIKASISCSEGMKGSFFVILHFGFSKQSFL